MAIKLRSHIFYEFDFASAVKDVKEDKKKGEYTIEAEVFGDGIDMWLRSQGDAVNLI